MGGVCGVWLLFLGNHLSSRSEVGPLGCLLYLTGNTQKRLDFYTTQG